LNSSPTNGRLDIDSDVGLDCDHGCGGDGLVDTRIPPVHRGGPSVRDCLHVMHRLRSNVRRLLNNRMADLRVMARREQETTFQAFNRGLVLDRAASSSTIRLNDRIHDR